MRPVAGMPTKQNNSIYLGYMLTEFSPPYRGAAINLAIDQAKADGLLPGYNIRHVRFLLAFAMM